MNDALNNTVKLGFGCMRLPLLDANNQKSIDIEHFKKMVDAFIAAGGTYFDTAFKYHDGKSEVALGEALVKRYPRETYTIATKTLAWGCRSEEAAKQNLPTSLHRLGTDYIDFYLMHNMNRKNAQVFVNYGMWDYIRQAKEDGKVRNIGYSIHDNTECLLDFLKMFPNPDFVQVQCNYLDWQNKLTDSKRLVETLQEKEIPIVIMEPARGGNLINLPERALNVLRERMPQVSPAELAYGFCLDIPGVLTVLSGASSVEQIQENMEVLKNHKTFGKAEQETLQAILSEMLAVDTINCTACGYCLKECPNSIKISTAFDLLNNAKITGNKQFFEEQYIWQMHGARASTCIECGKCKSMCPQKIDIPSKLKKVVEYFE